MLNLSEFFCSFQLRGGGTFQNHESCSIPLPAFGHSAKSNRNSTEFHRLGWFVLEPIVL